MNNNKRSFTKAVSLVLAFILALCPISFFFNTHATDPVSFQLTNELIEDVIIEVIWDTLKGWGIKVYESGTQEITENIKQILSGDLYEYLTDELHESFSNWITGLNWVYDNFGRRVMNALGLTHFYAFALWLQDKYDLTDDDIHYLQSSYYIGDFEVLTFPVYAFWHAPRKEGSALIQINNSIYQNNTYALPLSGEGTYSDALLWFSLTNGSRNYDVVWSDGTGTAFGGSVPLSSHSVGGYSIGNWYGSKWKPYDQVDQWIQYSGAHYALADVALALSGNNSLTAEGTYIDTDAITFPPDDPSWSQGMSIIYYPDGSIGYLEINWPDTVSVDNLPAIVSTGHISNLDVSSVTLPFSGFITMMGDGLDLITDIIYNFPSAIVAFALAIISATIVFGVIKVLKEH